MMSRVDQNAAQDDGRTRPLAGARGRDGRPPLGKTGQGMPKQGRATRWEAEPKAGRGRSEKGSPAAGRDPDEGDSKALANKVFSASRARGWSALSGAEEGGPATLGPDPAGRRRQGVSALAGAIVRDAAAGQKKSGDGADGGRRVDAGGLEICRVEREGPGAGVADLHGVGARLAPGVEPSDEFGRKVEVVGLELVPQRVVDRRARAIARERGVLPLASIVLDAAGGPVRIRPRRPRPNVSVLLLNVRGSRRRRRHERRRAQVELRVVLQERLLAPLLLLHVPEHPSPTSPRRSPGGANLALACAPPVTSDHLVLLRRDARVA
mmetsp:Transcript_17411/g.54386  ORF Transcript_17411/g.54386 Transcript_17411/m.54386 type:complete len:323 (-) Transcript_17411:65-1033(-)